MRIREEDLPLRLVGRIVRPEDIGFLRSLLAGKPGTDLAQLASEICRIWSWNKPNGALRVANAKLLLLKLHDSGLLTIPQARQDRRGTTTRSPSVPGYSQKPSPTTAAQSAEKVKKPVRIKEEDLPLRLIGRIVKPEDLEFLRSLIAGNSGATRAQLANDVCRLWSWNKPNGSAKVISAKLLLLKLHESGLLELPPARHPHVNHRKITLRTPAGEPHPKMKVELAELLPLRLQRVVTQPDKDLWRELIDRYHYLGHNKGVGAQLRYLVHSPLGIIALFGFGASAWHLKDRDQWIGWNEAHRDQFRHLVVNNSRFLILPWIKCENLASKLLSLVVHTIPNDWQSVYNYTPVLLETFVDQSHFLGTSYKAANWTLVGLTQGRGKKGSNKAKLPLKSIYLYPLTRDFRLVLTGRKHPD